MAPFQAALMAPAHAAGSTQSHQLVGGMAPGQLIRPSGFQKVMTFQSLFSISVRGWPMNFTSTPIPSRTEAIP